MRKQISFWGFCLLLLFQNRCEQPVQYTLEEDALSAFCVLNNFHPHQEVEVARTFVPQVDHRSESVETNREVKDATVYLVQSGQKYPFTCLSSENETRFSLYRSSDLQILPGQAYEISISHPKYGIVKAATRVPGIFKILSPENGSQLADASTIEVTFSGSEGAAGYLVGMEVSTVRHYEVNGESFDYYHSAPVSVDYPTEGEDYSYNPMVLIAPNAPRKFVFYYENIRKALNLISFSRRNDRTPPCCKIFVSALDEHFYQLYLTQNDLVFRELIINAFFTNDRAYSNIENGYGLFASALMDSVQLELPESFGAH